MENKKTYTISIYSEKKLGLLNRISGIFLRRHLNIESLNFSDTEINNIIRFTILVYIAETELKKVIKQIDKQVGVLKSFYQDNEKTVFLNTALFKVKKGPIFDDSKKDALISIYGCTIMEATDDYIIFSKQGEKEGIDEIYTYLEPFGIMQFVTS